MNAEQNFPDKAELLSRRPRTDRAFSAADIERLYGLYYNKEIPMTRVASTFSVQISTLLRWVAEMEWPKRRSVAPAPSDFPEAPSQGAARAGAFVDEAGEADAPDSGLPPEFDFDVMRHRMKRIAQADLNSLSSGRRPVTWADRERRSRALASLMRTIDRIDANLDTAAQAHAIELILHLLREGPGARNEVTQALRDMNAQLWNAVRVQMSDMMKKAGLPLADGARSGVRR